jgi:hypothetical protein
MKSPMLIGLVIGMCSSPSAAQNWASLNFPTNIIDWGNFYLDTAANELYASGAQQPVGGQFRVFKLNGSEWESIGMFSNIVYSIVRHNDTLIAAGAFSNVNGVEASRIAYHDDSGWHPYGSFDARINKLRVLDGELYAVGAFEQVDGQPADGIAKRVGGHWEPVGDFGEVLSFPNLFDVIKYQGQLVACGNMSIIGVNYRNVYVYENGQWGSLGGGLYGGASGGWEMTIYNGELILGGSFYISAGNAGQCIMRWNGSIWQPLGAGTTDNSDSYNSAPNIHALAVHNGKLFVGGGFSYAGHVPAKGIAVWDGDVWCGLGSDLQMVHDIEFVGDTLLAMTWNNWIDGEYNSGGVRYLHTTYADTCSLGTGMLTVEQSQPTTQLSMEDGSLMINGLQDGVWPYSVLDLSGRVALQGSLQSSTRRSSPIRTTQLGPGLYVLRIPGIAAQVFAIR